MQVHTSTLEENRQSFKLTSIFTSITVIQIREDIMNINGVTELKKLLLLLFTFKC